MTKRIEAIIASGMSEIVKDKVLANIAAASPGSQNAAEVIRDSNGKVIKVLVNLPDSASATAKAAIEANSGVAAVTEADIPAGFDGWDASSQGKTDLLARPGFVFALGSNPAGNAPTEVFNADGSVTYTHKALNAASDSNFMIFVGATSSVPGIVPAYPITTRSELKFKRNDASSDIAVGLLLRSNGYFGRIDLFSTATGATLNVRTPTGWVPTGSTITDTNYHVIGVELDGTGTLPNIVNVYLDGTQVASAQPLQDATASTISLVRMQSFYAGSLVGSLPAAAQGITFDYWRWTKP